MRLLQSTSTARSARNVRVAEAEMRKWCEESNNSVLSIEEARNRIFAEKKGIRELLAYLQAVRDAVRRPDMTQEQLRRVPKDLAFLSAMINFALDGASFNPSEHPEALKLCAEGS